MQALESGNVFPGQAHFSNEYLSIGCVKGGADMLAVSLWRASRGLWLALMMAGVLVASLPGLSDAKGKGPYADEMMEIKTNLKGFAGVKKVAIVGVVEVLEDLRSGKQDFSYQKIPSQKLSLRFNYFIPEGFTVLSRSAADVEAMLRDAGLGVGELLNFSQVGTIGAAYGADALLVGSVFSSTKNGYDVEVQSAVFVKLIDVKTGALIWSRELDKKELQMPSAYTRAATPNGGPLGK